MKHGLVRTTRIVSAVCTGLWSGSPTAGAEYAWQLAAAYGQDDAAGIVDSADWRLSATYYPRPVDDTHGPYDLAPFLDRSSRVTVGLSRAREETVLVGFHWGTSPGFIKRYFELYSRSTRETAEFFVSGRYVWPDSGWYVGGGTERADTDERPSELGVETSAYRVATGWYFADSTALDLTLGAKREKQEPDEVVCEALYRTCYGLLNDDIDTQEVALSVRHVGELRGATYSVLAGFQSSRSDYRLVKPRLVDRQGRPIPREDPRREASVLEDGDLWHSEEIRVAFLSGEWFPSLALGVRLDYARVEQELFGNTDGVGLTVNWFFRRNVAAEVSFMRTRLDEALEPAFRDSDTASVRLLGRF